MTLRHPTVWLQILFFFIYTGLEVTVGQWSFTILTESRLMPTEMAGGFVTIYWASILVGRVISGFLVDRIGIDRLLLLSTVAALLGTGLFGWNLSSGVSAAALAVTGLGLASIYPCMMMRTPQRIGKAMAAHAIGFQGSAAMLGAAALPGFAGHLAQRFNLEAISLCAVGMAIALCVLHEGIRLVSRRS